MVASSFRPSKILTVAAVAGLVLVDDPSGRGRWTAAY